MIIEFFGLSRTGKTTYKEELLRKGYVSIKEDFSETIKFFYFLKFLIKNLFTTIYLFYKLNSNYLKLKKFSVANYLKVFFMRNSYLTGVLSKYERIVELNKNFNKHIIADEFSLQSIFMVLQRTASEKEIIKILKILPKSDLVYVLEIDDRIRHERYKKTRYPAQWIELEYAKNWMNNSEFNYKLIKKYLINGIYIPNSNIKFKDLMDGEIGLL